MKSLMQIAEECDMRYNELKSIVINEKIVPAKREGRRVFFDKYQEDYMHFVLYFSLKINEITLNSKMNYEG
jgi:Zn-dependent peptidase ImmA (M78 family)